VTDPNKEWWPQAEAVVGFLNAYQITGDPAYSRAALAAWDFIEHHIVDREHGEWFWRVDSQGRPDRTEPKVSEWKEPYHGVRACLQVLHRVRGLAGGPRPD
jgi:mannobiose 2-epimerase